tara:strand:- start:92 stop:748 length:657 start_codon:yes stop_codon:yes gene_type:complete
MSIKSIKALEAKVKAAQKANATKIADAAATAKLEAKLKLESSKSLFESKVKLAVISGHTKTLQELIDGCSTLVDSVPITNTKTRSTRIWAGSRRFSFGTQINLMYQLATGILYSCADHKQLLLSYTNLDSELLEQFVDAFGTPAYYSRNFNTLVEATPYDIDNVLVTVAVMQSELGVIVDTSQLTTKDFSLEFGKAEIVANTNKLAAEEAIATADFNL